MKKTIGIDLGGTSVFGGVINENGDIIKKSNRDTYSAKNKRNVLNNIKEVIEELLDEDILGIGIGSPGFIDSKEGKVLEVGGNIKNWSNTNIKKELGLFFPKYPIFVENDANVAAICEKWVGNAKNLKSFLMITLGTGVGGAIFLRQEEIWKGENYQAAEFGHVILYPLGKKCNCGQSGCVEKYISGNAIESIYKERTGYYKSGRNIFKDEKDTIANEIIEDFTKDLAIYLVSLKNLFDPQGIIIGGGVINSKKYWWDKVIEKYKLFSNNPKTMKIIPAAYLNDSGMIGAGKIVFDNILNDRLVY